MDCLTFSSVVKAIENPEKVVELYANDRRKSGSTAGAGGF